jgi:hypothetical protein
MRAPRKSHGLAGRNWDVEVQGTVRPLPVVMLDVGAKHPLELAAREDQELVETLAADRAHPALGERIRVRSSNRCSDDAHAL